MEFQLKNDLTFFVIMNHPFVYSKRWHRTLSLELIDMSVHKLDAIVLGSFNEYDGSTGSSFFNTTKLYEKEVPRHKVEFGREPPPYVKDIGDIYKGPIVWVSMFAKYNEPWHQQALNMIKELQKQDNNRTNLRAVYGRNYIPEIGAECSSDSYL
jgi:hypothetical protein